MTDEEPTIPLEELGKVETVKVYRQAYVDRLEKRIAELEAQIERMMCCQNCIHFDFTEPNYCHKGVYREHQYVCDKWNFCN